MSTDPDTVAIDSLAMLSGHVRTETVHTAISDLGKWIRTRGHTARGALLLAFVAPFLIRKPAHSGHPPEGWTKVMLIDHLLPEANGVWWAPDEVVAELGRPWKYTTAPREAARSNQGACMWRADGGPA